MLGLGETDEEVIDAMLDMRDVGVDIFTLGQYLQPTPQHLPVSEFLSPEKFEHWRRYGEEVVGFRWGARWTVGLGGWGATGALVG
jgi:lipoic acid synthetase